MAMDIGPSRTKWWGPDRHIVIYYTNADRSELYFVTSVPEPAEWVTRESWSAKGDVKELRKAYEGFHPDVRAVLEACPDCHKWAILEREPLPRWSDGRVVLLGDACHPMTPYMAQGGATAIEDAAILARCLKDVAGERTSRARSSAMKLIASRALRASRRYSSANTWMKGGDERHELALWLRCVECSAGPAGADAGLLSEVGRGMSGPVISSAGSFTAPDGLSIAYRLHAASEPDGSAVRPRIALIHSLALDQSIWDGVVPLLTAHADVLTYDCRGHGKSGRSKVKYTTELFAADLANLLDHVNWPRITLAGCSMGGCILRLSPGFIPNACGRWR